MMFLVGVTEILRFALDDIATTRMFRREPHCNGFIFRESELPEGLKAVLFEMRYRGSGGSLVTNRNKLIELPPEALGGDCTNSLLRELLKKNFYFLLKRSSNKLFLKTPARNKNSPSRFLFLRRRMMLSDPSRCSRMTTLKRFEITYHSLHNRCNLLIIKAAPCNDKKNDISPMSLK